MSEPHTNGRGAANGAAGTSQIKTYSFPELTAGRVYANPPRPTSAIIKIPTSGISDKEKNMQVAHLTRVKNAWEVEGKKAEVEITMHNAHGKKFQAMGAAVQASTSLINANTAWSNRQEAIVKNRVAKASANGAIAGLPYEVEIISAELEKKKQNLIKAETELQQAMLSNSNARQDLIENEQLSRLAGYVVTPTVPGFMGTISALLTPSTDITFEE